MKKFAVGWEEWISLPNLDLPALKVKTDTGARTSSLHAFNIQPFGSQSKPKVRFSIHPIPDRADIAVTCAAPVIDRRDVTSSNGQTELRYVIRTPITLGDRTWEIDLTLANRENMAYRMLLGRAALEDIIVKPDYSFIQPELSFDVYLKNKRKKATKRPLRIAILTREPQNYSTQRLVEAAAQKDHSVELIDTKRCYLNIQSHQPEVHYDGKPLPFYDAVIPRIGASLTFYGMAVVRQFEAMGTYCVNTAEAIGLSRDKLAAHQILSQYQLAMPTTAFAYSPKDALALIDLVGGAPMVLKLLQSTQGKGVVLAETKKAATAVISAFQNLNANFISQEFIKEADGSDVRILVVGNKVVASMMRTSADDGFKSNLHSGGSAKKIRITKEERSMAQKASKALGLNIAGVDIIRSATGPKILEVNSSPGLEGIETTAEIDVASTIIEHIEDNVTAISYSKK